MATEDFRPGIYSVDYFSGAQCAIYIGDVWVDEVTSITYGVHQSRRPLYGYADQLFRDVSKGQVLVQGEFTINFKEAGYLWLVLRRYQEVMRDNPTSMIGKSPFGSSAVAVRDAIESIINNDGQLSISDRNAIFQAVASNMENIDSSVAVDALRNSDIAQAATTLGGFSSATRAAGSIGTAENIFEAFEDRVWQEPAEDLDAMSRRADDPDLNPFDIYMAFGDFAGDNSVNHTIQKITGVHIIGSGKQVVIDGQPIQESYSFMARNIV